MSRALDGLLRYLRGSAHPRPRPPVRPILPPPHKTTELSGKMRTLATAGHPRSAELYVLARALDTAAYATDKETAKGLLCAWARARKLWSECSGEALHR